jgi:peptidoglycan/xylan/chitin deacetylase (PgdA/CDA1 family)
MTTRVDSTTTLPVLTFHALEDRDSAISFPPHVFRRGLAHLRGRGYRTSSLTNVVTRLHDGLPLPARTIVITFDDGYRSVYDEAFPLLRQYGMTATIFLTVGKADAGRLPPFEGREMLSWSELREMQAAGFDIGAHTLTHPDLTRLPRDRVEAELRDSKRTIEDALGVRVDSFAYPYGRFDGQSHELARQHFSCACSDRLGLVRSASDPHALERVETYYLRTDRSFALVPTAWLEWYLRVRNVPRTVRRMVQPPASSGVPSPRA